MANVAFSNMHNLILPYLPGADLPIVDNSIRRVVREWLKRTTCMRETFVFPTVAGVSDYQLVPTFGQISSIMAAWDDPQNEPLKVITEDMRRPTAQARPWGWWEMIPGVIKMYPTPDDVYTITVNAAITLTQADVLMPEELIANYGEDLATGVMALMMSMPGKPWTQSKAAADLARTFNGAIRSIRGKLRDGGQPNQSTFTAARKFGK